MKLGRYHDELDAIENRCGVNVEIFDESGQTIVYTYTELGERIGVRCESMNPPLSEVMQAAEAIAALKALANAPARWRLEREPA